MLVRVCTPSSPFRERERERERKREGEKERERGREKEREKEGGRERKRERERERVVILKGMTVALAPFSYQVAYNLFTHSTMPSSIF